MNEWKVSLQKKLRRPVGREVKRENFSIKRVDMGQSSTVKNKKLMFSGVSPSWLALMKG